MKMPRGQVEEQNGSTRDESMSEKEPDEAVSEEKFLGYQDFSKFYQVNLKFLNFNSFFVN